MHHIYDSNYSSNFVQQHYSFRPKTHTYIKAEQALVLGAYLHLSKTKTTRNIPELDGKPSLKRSQNDSKINPHDRDRPRTQKYLD